MARHRPTKVRAGKTLRGTPEAQRHLYDWDLGKGLGLHCRKCGLPKPPVTEDETPCPGRHLATEADLARAREASLPNYLLSIAWVRQQKDAQIEMDPAYILASRAAFRAPLAKFGADVAREQSEKVQAEAFTIYRTVSADTPAFQHHLACCLVAIKLCNDGKVDPMNQAVLQGVSIIREADGPGAVAKYTLGMAQQHAGEMIRTAQKLGYYGGGVSSLRIG